MSYREKMIWGNLFGLIVAYSYYFSTMARRVGFSHGGLQGVFIATCMLIVIAIVYQSVIAARNKVEPKDERDIWIEGRAYRYAYTAQNAGVSLWVLWAIFHSLQASTVSTQGWLNLWSIGNGLLIVMLLGELVKMGTQLFFYRRDVAQ